jgi:hypothetical protein
LYGIAFGIAAARLTDEAIAQYDGIGVLRVEYNGKFKTTRHELAASPLWEPASIARSPFPTRSRTGQ